MEKPNGTLQRHLPFDKSFQRDPNRCGDLTKESSYRWFIFALAQNVLTFQILLLWKSLTVLSEAIWGLTKAFKGTRIDAVIWRKKHHTGDLFLSWHQIFWHCASMEKLNCNLRRHLPLEKRNYVLTVIWQRNFKALSSYTGDFFSFSTKQFEILLHTKVF